MTVADMIQIALYSFASGVTVILGGFLARLKVIPRGELGREISHGIVAFGGGVLVPFSLAGVAASMVGYLLLAGQERLVASLMVFSAGAILYLVFQDIAPMAKLRNHWTPATGAALGFMLGMMGQKILGA